MKYIITENQKYLIRRIQQFIEIVEEQIEGYEQNSDDAWWCSVFNPHTFLDNLTDRSIEEFINQNWDFFHDGSERGGSNMDISVLNRIVEDDYGNYIRNLFVRKCNHGRY